MLSIALKRLKDLGVKVAAMGIDEEELKRVKECIVYTYEPGEKENKFTLKLRIIAPTLLRCIEIRKLITSNFISLSDTQKIEGFTKIELTGGGSLKDEYNNVIHLLIGLQFTEKLE